MRESRRYFLRRMAALAGGGIAAGLAASGCAPGGTTVYRYTPSGNVIDLFLNWYPELYKTGGSVELLLSPSESSMLVVRTAIDRFSAVLPACTYGVCRVDLQDNYFKCRCHACRFALDGAPVYGPADKPLTSYRTEYRETSLRIFLS